MAFLGTERVFRWRQLQQHSLTRTGFGVRPGHGQVVHQAAPGKHGLLQGRARKAGRGVPQDAVQASPGRVRRDQQLNTVHGRDPVRVDRVRSRSAKVMGRYRFFSSAPGVMEVTTARPMMKRASSLPSSMVRTPQTL